MIADLSIFFSSYSRQAKVIKLNQPFREDQKRKWVRPRRGEVRWGRV